MSKKKSPVTEAITEKDLVGHSLDTMLTKSYGPKGTAKRKAAETRINIIAQNLVSSNELKELREYRHKSQAQVADEMNVDDSVVSKLEKNFEKAQLTTILRYAKALDVEDVNIVFKFNKKHSQVLHLHP